MSTRSIFAPFAAAFVCLFFPVATAASSVDRTSPEFRKFSQMIDHLAAEQTAEYAPVVDFVLKATKEDTDAVDVWMQAAADVGNAAAKRWILARTLTDIQPKDALSPGVCKAYSEIVKLAQKKYVPAMLDRVQCLRAGIGTQRDTNAADQVLKDACYNGNFEARFRWLRDTGRLASPDDKAKPEVASEIQRGNHYVMFYLATLAESTAEKIELFTQAAEKGSADAYYMLSALYSDTQPIESRELLEEAARRYSYEALRVLGFALTDEYGKNLYARAAEIKQDIPRGLHMLRLLACIGDAQACHRLGSAYYRGNLGLPQDYAKAYSYYSIARVQGDPAVRSARYLLLLLGQGVKQDTATAVKELRALSDKGFALATMHLAYAYYKGIGVQADAHKAADLLIRAASTGIPGAYLYLAFISSKGGPGLKPDASCVDRYINMAEIDLGSEARPYYESIVKQGDWLPLP